jgi:hypothetical protein
MTPLRQRMMDDLQLRNYSDRTIKAYLRCVYNFARHFGKSPDELGPAHLREYQLYLVKQKQCSWAVFNQTVCALRFFYNTTLGCKEMIEEIPYPRFEKRLPVVLSQTEVAALLQATRNLKHSFCIARFITSSSLITRDCGYCRALEPPGTNHVSTSRTLHVQTDLRPLASECRRRRLNRGGLVVFFLWPRA